MFPKNRSMAIYVIATLIVLFFSACSDDSASASVVPITELSIEDFGSRNRNPRKNANLERV